MGSTLNNKIDNAIAKGQYELAFKLLQSEFNNNPNDINTLFLCGLMLEKLKRSQEAFPYYIQVATKDPNNHQAYRSIGRLLKDDYQYFEALKLFKKAYEVAPEDDQVNNDLAFIYGCLGMSKESIFHYEKAMSINPNQKDYYGALIFEKNKSETCSLEELLNLSKSLNDKFYEPYKKNNLKIINEFELSFQKMNLDINRKIRLGFVSSDFNRHPVAYQIMPLMERLNKSKFEIFCYYNDTKKHNDWVTEIFSKNYNFKDITKHTTKEAANLVNKDHIDILFDLNGYTSGERLEIFKLKPAPIQISYCGYFGTLAIPEIDYIFAGKNDIKENEQKYHTEKIYYFPEISVHAQLHAIPEQKVFEAPCIKNKTITFASMNNLAKISFDNIKIWSEILKQVDNSIFIFSSKTFKDIQSKEYFRSCLIKCGVDPTKLDLRDDMKRDDFLKTYDEIDIALDPFPYTGSSTTVEALMLGVPVITLEGNKWAARMTSTVLKACKADELIAYNKEEYIKKAVELASNPEKINYYRKNLQRKVLESSMNIETHSKNFEKALLDIWQNYCTIR